MTSSEVSEKEGEELTQAVRRRIDDISRYNFLTNSGGVIATLGFIGTTWSNADAPGKLTLVPLGLFLAGLCLNGYALNARLLMVMGHGLDLAKKAEPERKLELPGYMSAALKGAQGAFTFGD
jgi:hypothetical protein